ncbi:unnamed protein product [Adineta ricciae]|uniref:Uncharacterized protein n=2 Tax=Adineta ricciae TaxID=249248 RepID=A0A814WZ56_ADIRI|nr:unnamed protein product [Adineta ricciae]
MKSNKTVDHELNVTSLNVLQTEVAQSDISNEYTRSEKRTCVIFVSSVIILIAIIIIIILTIIAKEDPIIKKSVTTTTRTTEVLFNVTMTVTEGYPSWNQYGISINVGMILRSVKGITIDDDDHETIYFADSSANCIVRRRSNVTKGEVIAGGNGRGNKSNQLHAPTHTVIDKAKNSIIICDSGNRRVLRWSLQNSSEQHIIASNVTCRDIAIDRDGAIYISDHEQCVVTRWKEGESRGKVVAGGNGKGRGLDQLHYPTYLAVDKDYSVYVSDSNNNRVMKWLKNAKEGIVVAGGRGSGAHMKQLNGPNGIFVDQRSNVYVADSLNHRVMRWSDRSRDIWIAVGGYGDGRASHQLFVPEDISIDRQGNFYVIDDGNRRIQKFEFEP